ncbi:hypothetical protein [Brevibacillus dissolubilis]|uniref:hypothetical protein n=1 Tax=Brevibacillus dissolubilis TaxID=1844116 RepID=UPI001116401A|nr:hypothetical protein [Brevibacillus dissolubilis]
MEGKRNTVYYLEGFEKSDLLEQARLLGCFLDREDILLFSYYHVEENAQTLEILKKLSSFLEESDDVYEDDKETTEFISSRTVVENTEWLLPREPFRKVTKVIWFRPKDISEVVQSIKINQNFICVVLNQKDDFSKHSFVLSPVDSDNGVELEIIEKVSGKFKELVLPKLQKVIEHLSYKQE